MDIKSYAEETEGPLDVTMSTERGALNLTTMGVTYGEEPRYQRGTRELKGRTAQEKEPAQL